VESLVHRLLGLSMAPAATSKASLGLVWVWSCLLLLSTASGCIIGGAGELPHVHRGPERAREVLGREQRTASWATAR
jgi:hypothetical protein